MKFKSFAIFFIVGSLFFSMPSFAQTKNSNSEIPTINIVGAIAGTAFGFGIGHPFQGRYLDKGWIFTVGEITSGILWAAGTMGYREDRRQSPIGGLAGLTFLGLRVWETVDLWTHLHDEPSAKPKVFLIPREGDSPLLAMGWRF